MARVGGELDQARRGHLDLIRARPSISTASEPAPSIEAKAPSRLVVDLQERVALVAGPGPLGGAPGEDLIAWAPPPRPRLVGRTQRFQRRRERLGVDPLAQRLADRALGLRVVPSPSWYQRRAPPRAQRKSEGQPWEP